MIIRDRCSRKERNRHNNAWNGCKEVVWLDYANRQRSVVYNCVCVGM
jgi:hypothetical protein